MRGPVNEWWFIQGYLTVGREISDGDCRRKTRWRGYMSTELILSAIIFIGLAVVVPVFMAVTAIFGPRIAGKVKNEAYESGVGNVIGAVDQKFSVKFYLLAILFLIFDIEAVFMYPWAVTLRQLGWFGFVEMVTFMVLLLMGLIYILKKGVLNWR
jgi:NADH-quinone oxidoreductase subunit A